MLRRRLRHEMNSFRRDREMSRISQCKIDTRSLQFLNSSRDTVPLNDHSPNYYVSINIRVHAMLNARFIVTIYYITLSRVFASALRHLI